MPQLRTSPAVTEEKETVLPTTVAPCTGRVELVSVPLPNLPLLLSPQHQTVPSVATAQVCVLPAAICLNFSPVWTAVGSERSVVEPSPSWPLVLSPQQ